MMEGVRGRGHAWRGCAWHTVNERAVRILLECILVVCVDKYASGNNFYFACVHICPSVT